MTVQIPELVIFEGEKTETLSFPSLPKNHPSIIKLNDIDIRKNIREVDSFIGSSACWRNYIGTWEIKDKQLYLVDLEGCYQIIDNNPIFANWMSGLMRVPRGKLLYCDRSGVKVYEQEIHLRIDQGKIVESTIIDANSSQ